MSRRWLLRVALVVATVACAWLTSTRLRVSSDLTTLFPDRGDAAALARWTRAFGGSEPVVVLVRGPRAEDVGAAADEVAASLRAAPSIARVIDRAPASTGEGRGDPTLAWAYSGPAARATLGAIVTPEGMRARLAETRALLLAPVGDEDLDARLARDPLRLAAVPWEGRAELAAGVTASPGGAFEADQGRARLVLAAARGSAFESEAARAVVEDVERAGDAAKARCPGVTVELAGGHAIAWATERMLRRDLEVSGTLSAVLASVAFVATFRRARALVAVLPPLAIGTVWTTGLAALMPAGIHVLAVAFAAVVVGVGVDTGVHVYAAVLEARRAGCPPGAAAARARATTWRPTLTAAAVAAVAFASLALSGLRATVQLGVLCGAGELLTAIAILVVTPEIGAWLERGPPPAQGRARWLDAVAWLTATRGRAGVALAACAAPVLVVGVVGWSRPADALVAVRPAGLEPLAVQARVQALFGGDGPQWIVLTADADEERARARADRVAEALEGAQREGLADGFDALATYAPARETVRARLATRDALDLPSRREALAAALREEGFAPDATAPALEAFAHPAPASEVGEGAGAGAGAGDWLLARHLAHEGGEALVATYVRPHVPADPRAAAAVDARLRAVLAQADPASAVTGFDAIDRALRDVLARDLVLVGGVALGVVALAMRVTLRSARLALIALATLVCEMALVGLAMRVLGVRWHVYDALVLPVLFGVTVDESMFLLHAARGRTLGEALHAQGPLVASTALTTAAGFAALLACRFDGLRDLGAVGALGVLAGLVAALVVVPAALRLGRATA
jgi:predicted RND superfamily exporter protein